MDNLKDRLEVHLNIPKGYVNPRKSLMRAYPIFEQGMPLCNIAELSASARKEAIFSVLDWLDVERNPRYLLTNGKTYCNIYAYDLSHLLGAYLPRVWWNEESIRKIKSFTDVKPIYGETIFEQNCNSLSLWLKNYGSIFNWKKLNTVGELPRQINNGAIGCIISKQKLNGIHGHISMVVPEYKHHFCIRLEDGKHYPLQSQAGTLNKKLFTGDNWWEKDTNVEDVSFWIFDL
jgi:hypothetical protein